MAETSIAIMEITIVSSLTFQLTPRQDRRSIDRRSQGFWTGKEDHEQPMVVEPRGAGAAGDCTVFR